MPLSVEVERDLIILMLAAMSQSNSTKTVAGTIRDTDTQTMAERIKSPDLVERVLAGIASRQPANPSKDNPDRYAQLHAALNDTAGPAPTRAQAVDRALDDAFTQFSRLLDLVWGENEWSSPPDHPRRGTLYSLAGV